MTKNTVSKEEAINALKKVFSTTYADREGSEYIEDLINEVSKTPRDRFDKWVKYLEAEVAVEQDKSSKKR